MKFGKIDYLNLLPFDVFIKKYKKPPSFNIRFRNYPSKLNTEFLYKRIDAGFISSIASMHSKKTNTGIVAYGAVWSVIIIDNENSKFDYQSASSNALSKLLNLHGEVLIGDRALKYKLENNNYLDLGEEWYKKYKLPFVFGILCFNKYRDFYLNLGKSFNKTNIKIPHYIIKKYSLNSGISESDIKKYLNRIHYKITSKAIHSLNLFHRQLRINNIHPPKRFDKLK